MSEYIQNLNPTQRDAAVNYQGASLIIAGAGSGKTRVLTCRIKHRKRHESDKAHAESDGHKRPHPRLPERPAADKAQTRIAQRRRSQQATSDERRETRHPFQIKRNEQTEVN